MQCLHLREQQCRVVCCLRIFLYIYQKMRQPHDLPTIRHDETTQVIRSQEIVKEQIFY